MSKSKGRGRGRGGVSLNIEAIGFGRGEQLPTPALQPPPLQPVCLKIFLCTKNKFKQYCVSLVSYSHKALYILNEFNK